jgi:hypothetical protein
MSRYLGRGHRSLVEQRRGPASIADGGRRDAGNVQGRLIFIHPPPLRAASCERE